MPFTYDDKVVIKSDTVREGSEEKRRGFFELTTGSGLTAASDIQRPVPTHMADIRCDWLTNENTDCCFVVIGLTYEDNPTVLCCS